MKSLIIFLLIISTTTALYAQFFGKNKVQYTTFDWQYLQSEHFDIYFTDGGFDAATFVAQVAEESYQQLQKSLRYELVDRIKVIVYNSHNDFQQTNVTLEAPEESVGGFTEFLKNRVVIPYEGEWEKFRHVIHHELTHAVMLQMLYGAGVQSIVTGLTQLQLPLWLIEGLAEYESRGWDIESDMFMRDATLNGYLPDIPYLSGFLAYKGGQSVLNYVAERYGEEKVGELLGKIKISKNMSRGLKEAIGLEMDEFSKRWQRYLKRKYWPDIANRDEPEEFAKRVTDHLKARNFINTSPAVSHKGDKIAFLSDRDDYFDIYLASAIDGRILKKLVRGQRAGNLEQLNWLQGAGIAWSPDDRYITFSAKTGAKDALHIIDIKTGQITRTITPELDAVYNPSWKPDGTEIAFMGVFHGRSDIYSYNLDTDDLRKITDDIFSDIEPKWSPDGTKLVFSSDRGDHVTSVPPHLTPMDIDMKNYDIFEINADGSGLKKVTGTEYLERTPLYSPDGTTIAFVSDRSGVSNIYLRNLQTDEEWPITNAITGVFLPTWGGDANRLAFTSFYYAGYDIFIMKNPLDIQPGEVTVELTRFVADKHREEETAVEDELVDMDFQRPPRAADEDMKKYRNFIFDENFAQGEIKDEETEVFLDSSEYILPSGDFRVNDYKVKFSPDLVYGAVGYNQFFGTQGYANFLFSDVLGDHWLNIAANLFGDFRNADYALTYLYLPKRIDLGIGAYHRAYYFYSYNTGWVRDRNYGLSVYASNPFDTYRRLSLGLTAMGINRTYMDLPDDVVDVLVQYDLVSPRNRYFLLGNLTYSKDTTIWGYTGPVNGGRYAMGLTYSPGVGKNGIDFTTIKADWRRYLRLNKEFTFAIRGAGGMSLGKHPQKFFLGGTYNWINYNYSGRGIRVDHIEEIYFASFEMPLRGHGYYAAEGTRYLMTNLEFRFTLLRRLLMGFPLPIELYNVGGALFTDMGVAWDQGDQWKPFVKSPSGFPMARDLLASIGFGARINLGFFLLRMDLAWPTDFYRTDGKPSILWSLGGDF